MIFCSTAAHTNSQDDNSTSQSHPTDNTFMTLQSRSGPFGDDLREGHKQVFEVAESVARGLSNFELDNMIQDEFKINKEKEAFSPIKMVAASKLAWCS